MIESISFKGHVTFENSSIESVKTLPLLKEIDFSYSNHKNCSIKVSFLVTFQGVTECHNYLPDTPNNSIRYSSVEFTEEYLIELLKENPLNIIVWANKDTQSIYISRDIFGTVPIYYSYSQGKSLFFSTQINNLLVDKDYTFEIDTRKVKSYFSIPNLSLPYAANTFFSGINAVPPAHFIKVSREQFKITSYTNFSPAKYSGFRELSEYGSAFRSLFLKSVERHTKGVETIGMHLSGGMDSSSVAVATHYVSPQSSKHSYFYDIESATSGEKAYSEDVALKIGSFHHPVIPKYQFIDELYSFTQFNGQPLAFLGATGMWHQSIEEAVKQNCDIFLTGHGGDIIVGNGQGYLPALFKEKNWDVLSNAIDEYCETEFREASSKTVLPKSVSERRNDLLKREFLSGLKSSIKRRSVVEFSQLLFTANNIFHFRPHSLAFEVMKGIWETQIGKLQAPQSILENSPFLTSELKNPALFSFNDTLVNENLKYHNEILFNQNVNVNEDYYSLGAFLNIDIRHPFLDKDLYELCLAVPDRLRFNKGYSRGPLREGLKDLLPNSVARRISKTNFQSYFTASVLILYKESKDLLCSGAPIWEYVDSRKFNTYIKFLQSDKFPFPLSQVKVTFAIVRTINLAVWLDICQKKNLTIPEYQYTFRQ